MWKQQGVYYNGHVPHQQTNNVGGNHSFSQKRIYQLNEFVGSENRYQEFKKGPKFIEELRANVAKYMCGFVNSNVDGKILIGVEDNGLVQGVVMYHQQRDKYTLRIDEAMKEISPNIFPESYNVTFHDVANINGRLIPDLYVIEISIKGKSLPHDQLYSCNKGVFMRRDGGLQNLSSQEIQQWVRQHGHPQASNINQELNNVKNQNMQKIHNLETELKRVRAEKTSYQDRNRDLMTELEVMKSEMSYRVKMEQEQSAKDEENKDSNQELKQEISQLRDLIEKQSSQNKSKVCVVM